MGIRHIDTAFIYLNEAAVGSVVIDATSISSGSLKREDFFISTKLWNTYHSRERVKKAINVSLKFLNTRYVDLFYMHFPEAFLVNI